MGESYFQLDDKRAVTEACAVDAGPLRARVGTVLRGKWMLERLLGYGGMAAVYVARHRIGRVEAVKILHRNLLSNTDLLVRFEREARVANRFKHPGAIEITDVDVSEDGCPFLVMELAEGVNLAEHCRRRPIHPLEVLGYADQILDVLAVAHPMGIVHRDIKPANLVLQTDGRLRVLDFGVAKIEGSTFTEQGATVGTAAYMPPEQVRGEAIDGRADLFAVGATMYRLLTGKQVREGNNAGEILYLAATTPAPHVRETRPDVPEVVAAIVDRGLAFELEDRYQNAREMQAEVRAAIRLLMEPTVEAMDEMMASPDTVVGPPPLAILQFPLPENDPSEEPTSITPKGARGPAAPTSGAYVVPAGPTSIDDDEGHTLPSIPAARPKQR
ncbi:MAG: serine/threonine protein kinase [Polyangiaceae bacterium]|nr:serine/threonine protein kinase [Polyangiaceae bacterium]